jgi:hypothetical protein
MYITIVLLCVVLSCFILLPFFRTRDLDLVASRHHLADMGSRLRVTTWGSMNGFRAISLKHNTHTLILCFFDLFNNSMY